MTRHATTLQRVIHTAREDNNLFSENEIRAIATKIISGIQFLHENQIIHRDIKVCQLFLWNFIIFHKKFGQKRNYR